MTESTEDNVFCCFSIKEQKDNKNNYSWQKK